MSEYRYSIDDDGVIRRGQIQRFGDDDDTWANYWDGDQMIAFTVDYYHGRQHVNLVTHGNDVTTPANRILYAFERRGEAVLDRMARLLTGNDEARFIFVNLDRGQDMYALAWDGDPERTWRDEIEAVYNHEVYRIVADRQLHTGVWLEDESDCTEYYGEGSALDEAARQFPLTQYPAETTITSSN